MVNGVHLKECKLAKYSSPQLDFDKPDYTWTTTAQVSHHSQITPMRGRTTAASPSGSGKAIALQLTSLKIKTRTVEIVVPMPSSIFAAGTPQQCEAMVSTS
jgi:hypothetical protein